MGPVVPKRHGGGGGAGRGNAGSWSEVNNQNIKYNIWSDDSGYTDEDQVSLG